MKRFFFFKEAGKLIKVISLSMKSFFFFLKEAGKLIKVFDVKAVGSKDQLSIN